MKVVNWSMALDIILDQDLLTEDQWAMLTQWKMQM